MKLASFIFAAVLAVSPVLAQDTSEPAPPTAPETVPEDEFGFFGEAARGLLEDFARRMAPTLEDMQNDLAPALEDLAARLGELNAYHPPEVLPNGDIIIRRKQPGEDAAPEPGDPPEGAIDL